MAGTVLYERDGHVALLTLNRPDALNAVNAALADELGALLERAAANAPLSVQHTKRVLHQTSSAGSDWDSAWSGGDPWRVNAAAMDAVFGSADAVEGATAFAQKRAPVWTGH
jgi:crotonobetainyl-CoA hydratase